ncbi:hypothetical protein ILYODFUR_037945 [Ilyodon furcidens]|uniref:Uncharacterized protein n=1 Tax=Ilyodon furcidens TaxID=33524 RepID=A0ABV0TEQ5_9TELE
MVVSEDGGPDHSGDGQAFSTGDIAPAVGVPDADSFPNAGQQIFELESGEPRDVDDGGVFQLSTDFESLSFASMSLSLTTFLEVILDDQACLRFVDFYPIICLRLDFASSWQFSCSSRLLDQAVSITCPPSNINLRTPNSLLSAPSSHRTAPRRPSMDSPSLSLDPESLYPWRPDHSVFFDHYVPDYHPQNKLPFFHSVLRSALCMWVRSIANIMTPFGFVVSVTYKHRDFTTISY